MIQISASETIHQFSSPLCISNLGNVLTSAKKTILALDMRQIFLREIFMTVFPLCCKAVAQRVESSSRFANSIATFFGAFPDTLNAVDQKLLSKVIF